VHVVLEMGRTRVAFESFLVGVRAVEADGLGTKVLIKARIARSGRSAHKQNTGHGWSVDNVAARWQGVAIGARVSFQV